MKTIPYYLTFRRLDKLKYRKSYIYWLLYARKYNQLNNESTPYI